MARIPVFLLLFLWLTTTIAQVPLAPYEPDAQFPFGRPHPDAPAQVQDFDPMIGVSDCWSLNRNPDGSWQDTVPMVWKFKYILNGTGVQDEVWREGNYATSIRQYKADSAKWVVTYYSYPAVGMQPGVWHGAKQGEEIVLKMSQKSPGRGLAGNSTLTFYDISKDSFRWRGEWIDSSATIVYPFWYIGCEMRD